ncbi:MAG: selenocysteine-specific translation elongation factor [Fimbriimonadaceae bacterium]|nr:MAG: selenocysteine-specific translation elongation factor [Fimbriimonadaceae bacterium]
MARLIGTAGHVDHGKTTLIRALTGIDADRLPEEKRRGLTIDIGFAYIDLPRIGRVSIVDVPGHERFLANMLVGALGVDVALLCVAADESVMPQTREHLQILSLLPVERLVVALTRADLVDEEMVALASDDVEELLRQGRFAGSPLVPVSAVTGQGLDALREALAQALDREKGEAEGPWYLPIDRVFTVKGHGRVVTGTLMRGRVHPGEEALVQPGGLRVRIRQVRSHEETREEAEKGQRTALNVSGPEVERLERGMLLGAPGSVAETLCLDARMEWVGQARHGSRVRVSIGADEAMARLFLNDGDPGLAQLRFERPVGAAQGQPLILRRYSPPTLLGGGRVLVVQAEKRRKNAKALAAKGGSLRDSVVAILTQAASGAPTEAVCRETGLTAQALGGTFEDLRREGEALGFAGLWFTPETFAAATGKLADALRALHESDPRRLLWPREEAVKRANLGWSGKPLDRIVASLVESARLRGGGNQIGLAGFRVELPDKQRALLDRVAQALQEGGPSPLPAVEVADLLKVPRQAVEEILRIGVASGELVRVGEGLHYPVGALEEFRRRAQESLGAGPFAASAFREALGTTRKYAIPILEAFDARGWTVRRGDERVFVRTESS